MFDTVVSVIFEGVCCIEILPTYIGLCFVVTMKLRPFFMGFLRRYCEFNQ